VALKKENPNSSNYDIREIVMTDCISIWQKATLRDALPDEYKEKQKQEAAEESHRAKYGSAQTTEFDDTENRTLVQDSNLAESGSFSPVEDFSKMNRGQDVITESEKAKRLEQRLNEAEEERMILRREIDELSTTVKVLKEKTTPELLKELQEKFADQPGLIDAKKLQKDTGYVSLFYFVKNGKLAKSLQIKKLYALHNSLAAA
jgi:hypothetical protein